MKSIHIICLAVLCYFSAGQICAQADPVPGSLKALSEMTQQKKQQQEKEQTKAFGNQVRYKALEQAALTLSIQTAVKYRYDQLNEKMNGIASDLDKLDFSLLLVNSGKVMPPVIREAKQALQIKSAQHSIYSQQVFQILKPALIVINTPTWRQYLIKEFDAIEEINPLLLPQNKEERQLWKKTVSRGWQIGLKQADSEFLTNWNRLVRDFLGLITYHRLALQGVVSVPMVAEGKLGIQVRDKTLDIDQRVFRITSPTKFNEVDKWIPIIHTNKSPLPSGS